jgi:prephenate dehydratase
MVPLGSENFPENEHGWDSVEDIEVAEPSGAEKNTVYPCHTRRPFVVNRETHPHMQAVTLGPAGTYSHRAASAVADDVDFRESVTAIVEAVADESFERGVVPIENSIEGSVTETLDALADREVAVVREVVTPIRHALLAQSGNFSTIASHSQALAQCRSYLESEYPEANLEAVASTARGVERAREDPTVAGIGHPDNAGDDLEVVAEGIQDRTSNATRFFVIAPTSHRSEAGGKSSLVVYPNANYPGLLLELLEPFADRDINLTRVESRPSGERLGDYVFHVDFAAGLYEERSQAAIAEVEAIAENGWVRRLGSYDTEHVLY